ncbi:hypothetical protein F4560_007292 [Saccharothrix ecbatanensis]|uniref:Uncharacterized protein n=1 Tax=Saccharothrix ecbatanensis TaxID=1105145 RepID=A0A7W9M518_9PSEU|nr:hypothetical protein [Saccharothrix ecbatanensis]
MGTEGTSTSPAPRPPPRRDEACAVEVAPVRRDARPLSPLGMVTEDETAVSDSAAVSDPVEATPAIPHVSQ